MKIPSTDQPHSRTQKWGLHHFLLLLSAYFLLLAWNGYFYGQGDMIELLPYAKWLNDNSLYPHDFFIQNISVQNFNERYVLALLFSKFESVMPQLAFLLHALTSLFLLEALYRIAKMFISSEIGIWVAILLPSTFFMNWNLGGNEIYIPMVVSGTIAIAIAIWAIYFFLKKGNRIQNDWLAFILLAVAACIQPLVSFQLFLVLAGVRVVQFLFPKIGLGGATKIRSAQLLPILFYLLTGGVWIYWINSHFSEGAIEPALFFEFLEFRLAHHFIPSYFSKKSALLLIPMFGWGLFFYYKKNRELFFVYVLILLGAVIYVIGVEWIQNLTVASSQWFKTTLWLKTFSLIAIFSFLENKFPFFREAILEKIGIWGLRVVGIISLIMILHPIGKFKNKNYDFPFLNYATSIAKMNQSKMEIAEIAKANTPKDATFVIPSSHTHFKNYSERSTYIDLKAVIHRKHAIPIWYERIKEIYGIDISTRRKGEDFYRAADENFRNMTLEDVQRFLPKGIQYLLTFKAVKLPLEVVGENEDFVIYQLE